MHTKLSVFCSKVIEAGWLATVVVVPLFFNIYTARTFEPDKITLMRSIVSIMILAWLIKVTEEGGSNTGQPFADRFKDWLKKPMVVPSVLIVVAYIISTLLSISPLVSLWGSYQRMQGSYTFISYVLIFGLMATNMTRREQVDRFITTVILTSIPVSLYGIIQHNGLDPLPWAGDVTSRVASNMGNAIFVASYLIMVIPLTLSRLISSMKAIVTEEDASWGHTVLSAIYIFVLAIQVLTVLYSGSRGPQIGLLGSFALIGLLLLLILRRKSEDKSILSFKEIGSGIVLVGVLGLSTALFGGLGFMGGKGLGALLALANLEVEGVAMLGAALGGLIGFAGVYIYLAAAGTGWRWQWISWPVLGIAGLVFVLLLNNPTGPLKGLRDLPYLGRLGSITNTEDGTGKVRVLIWEGAINLISPHKPLGAEGEFTDSLNSIRPIIGYGPESMFNAFAFAYPPGLAYVESRGSSADRSHNETMDSLVITGFFGFATFYLLIGSLFFYATKWLGWIPDKPAKFRAIGLMAGFGLAGGILPYFIQGNFSLSAVGLPFGLFGGLFLHICLQAILGQPKTASETIDTDSLLLIIGLFGALLGHFLEVHFVFSIAATYTYFWAYLGLLVVVPKIRLSDAAEEATEGAQATAASSTTTDVVVSTPLTRTNKRRKRIKGQSPRRSPNTAATDTDSESGSWEMWLGSLGLAMAIILIILTFDFVPVQFDLSTGRYSLLWMTSITFLVGIAMAMSDLTIKQDRWQSPVNWGRAVLLYCVTSLGYAGLYILLHSQQRNQLLSGRISDPLQAANGLAAILIGFYVALFILMLIIGVMLAQKQVKRLPAWQVANWWLYPFLVIAVFLLITFKNVNVVKADLFLKEGDRYRNAQQWNDAIRIHKEAISLDSDEDFYYLMLALDYQLMAQDGRLSDLEREQAWVQGEKIALDARNLNKYNPDNSGNMGRYYFTLGQVFNSQEYYQKAINFFLKVVQLAPQNVQYYDLLAQTYYILGDFDASIEWLRKSDELDPLYVPTSVQLGDTYAAKADVESALAAHTHAISLEPGAFADANFDNRLNFYISANKIPDLVGAFEAYIADNTEENTLVTSRKQHALWAIGHTYLRSGDLPQATNYIQQAIDLGYSNPQVMTELADAYLAQESYEQAEITYQQALQQNGSNQAQIFSSLGYIYARTGRLQEAIDANLKVLESLPDDYDSNKNLALLYQQAGQIDQALAHANRALELAPEESKADLTSFISQLETMQPATP